MVFGLPDIALAQTPGVRNDYPGAVRIVANVADRYALNPFSQGGGRWETFPNSGHLRVLPDPDGNPHVLWACVGEGAAGMVPEYTVRFLGYSRLGAFVQQYEEIELPLRSCITDVLPLPEFTVVVVASEGGGQATVTWNEKAQWTRFRVE